MRYYNNYGFPHYVPVAEKQARAKRKLEELRKNHPGVRPVAGARMADRPVYSHL